MTDAGSESNITHSSSVDAEMNGVPEVVLFHASGRSIRVEESEVDFWVVQGFRRELADIEETAAELKALFPAALDSLLRFVKGVTSDGVIDPSDESAKAEAEYAMRRLETTYGLLIREIENRYPVRQGEAVRMTDKNGDTHWVDPNQVDLYSKRHKLTLASGSEEPQ